MLPAIIRVLNLANAGEREQHADRAEELVARREGIEAALVHLSALAAERALPDEIVRPLRTELRDRLKHFEHAPRQANPERATALADEIYLALIAAERARINQLYRQGTLKDEGRRRLERELDPVSYTHLDVYKRQTYPRR